MSEANYMLGSHDKREVWAIGLGVMLAFCPQQNYAETIVAALNEVDELREQVRLYEQFLSTVLRRELALREGSKTAGATIVSRATELHHIFSTPTAAIAAAEKKEQAK